jgi:hypothetical protein
LRFLALERLSFLLAYRDMARADTVVHCPLHREPVFHFDTVAGRYNLLCFFQSAALPGSEQVLGNVLRCRDRFDDANACFFGVSTDPEDERQSRVQEIVPGIRFFWDFAVRDYGHKRRRDQEISEEPLRKACMFCIHDRLVPEIHKAFQCRATRIERYIVACYEAATGGHFRAHRDNTTKGTAHRRFAVSLMLNTGEHEGGMVQFPEFGPQV